LVSHGNTLGIIFAEHMDKASALGI
jgi:hypothetical protein